MAPEATVLAVKQPGMRTERDLYELGRIVLVLDRRGPPPSNYPGEGLLVVPGVSGEAIEGCLEEIDDRWGDLVEILEVEDRLVNRLLKR